MLPSVIAATRRFCYFIAIIQGVHKKGNRKKTKQKQNYLQTDFLPLSSK